MIAISHKGQRYELVGEEPYTRRDGSQSSLIRWNSQCAACGAPFSLTTANGGAFSPNRRCSEHRQPGVKP